MDETEARAATLRAARGRTRGQVEADVLGGALTERATAQALIASPLTERTFTVSRHRAMLRALRNAGPGPARLEAVATALRERPDRLREWVLSTSPSSPLDDIALLAEWAG